MINRFMFATGIENSYPTITVNGCKKRIDQMEKCRHYECWEEDFHLVKNDLGCDFLRYGPPYYKVHLSPGRYDWEFTDMAFGRLRGLRITPIVDLCHFGVPDWIGDFQNPDFPYLFAEYARAFAERFPWCRLYTPINEIFITAQFSAGWGWWNEQKSSDPAFVTALKHLCKANVMAMHAILEVQPDATFIQSESSEYFHAQNPSCQDRAYFLNHRRFLSLDLTYGREVNARMYEYLLDNGMTRTEYQWFRDNQVKAFCVMGTDYYMTNEHLVCAGEDVDPAGEIFGYYVITKQYYDRYRLPVMHTETNYVASDSEHWLRKEWAQMVRLRLDGVPIVGFTWYSLTDQIDWDTGLREENNRVHTVGLYDLDRKIRPVGTAYKHIIRDWEDMLPTTSTAIRLYL
ncbi:MAG TPA: family 1 glycosylhydrolase [Fimbriimonas sp.]